jgi:hypothetical protein
LRSIRASGGSTIVAVGSLDTLGRGFAMLAGLSLPAGLVVVLLTILGILTRFARFG